MRFSRLYHKVIEVEQVLEGTPGVPQSVVAGRPIEIADEEVVLEGTPLGDLHMTTARP